MFKVIFLILLWLFLVTVVTVAAMSYFTKEAELEHEERMTVLEDER